MTTHKDYNQIIVKKRTVNPSKARPKINKTKNKSKIVDKIKPIKQTIKGETSDLTP